MDFSKYVDFCTNDNINGELNNLYHTVCYSKIGKTAQQRLA